MYLLFIIRRQYLYENVAFENDVLSNRFGEISKTRTTQLRRPVHEYFWKQKYHDVIVVPDALLHHDDAQL